MFNSSSKSSWRRKRKRKGNIAKGISFSKRNSKTLN
jgi:hypothetical protein